MRTTPWQRIQQGLARTARHALVFCAVVLLVGASDGFAQQFTFRPYREQDGLTNLAVTCLIQDRSGFVWICTENGLFRHDGTDFERFGESEGLVDTNIRAAIEDPSGQLWIGTSHDLYRGDGHHFDPIRPDGRILDVELGQQLVSLAQGGMLVLTQEHLLELHAGPSKAGNSWTATPFFTPEQIRANPGLDHLSSVSMDHAGRIFLGCSHAICMVDHGHISTWDTHVGVPEDTWLSWLVDRDGRLWVRGLKHMVTLDLNATRFQLRDPPHSQLTSQLQNVPLSKDPDGRIITRTEIGLARWDQGHWEEFNQKNGLEAIAINAVLVDRDGAVWLGTPGHGVIRWLGYGHFESWTSAQGLGDDMVWSALRSTGRGMLIGGSGGCQRMDTTAHRALPCGIEGIPNGEIQLMAERADHSIWVAMTTGKLLRVAPGQQRAIPVTTLPPMRALYGDARNRLWVLTTEGIYVAEPGANQVHVLDDTGKLGEFTDAMEDGHGVMWFAGVAGLLRLSEGGSKLIKIEDEHARAGFAAVAACDGGWLWLGGSSHGVMHVHVEGDQVDSAHWESDPMLANASVLFIRPDDRGWIWVGTDSGVAVNDGRVWRKFTQRDGLIWNDTNQNSFWADWDGSVWVGTSGGLTHIVRPEGLMGTNPLDLRITHAKLGAEALDAQVERQIPWDPNAALNLHLADLEFGENREIALKVRLRGLSDAWFETRDRDLHYPGLEPGHYRFEASAVDHAHQRSSGLVTLSFEVLPPWWRTRWFASFLIAVGVALLAGAWHWRMRKLRAHKRALERQLKEHEALLERATRDALTGLWNRTAILEILAREVDQAKKTLTPLSVAIIDVDHFKSINDTCGHLGGDEVLRTLGAQLTSRIRTSDSLGRFGGEELLLVMPGMPPQRPCLPVERLRQAISEIPFSHGGLPIRVTASFGMAWLMPNSDISENLIARADAALYAAKNAGRNRVGYAPFEPNSVTPAADTGRKAPNETQTA